MTDASRPAEDGHLARDGHLHDLAIDRYLVEDAGQLHLAVDEHIADCDTCRERIEAVRRHDAGISIASRWPASMDGPGATVIQLAPRRAWKPSRRVATAAGLFAAAAALLLFSRVGFEAGDDFRTKGGVFDLEVWVHDGSGARQATSGEVVHPGDRIGFRVDVREPGHVLILGVDGRGRAYVGYPQGGQGRSQHVAATQGPTQLNEALRFDEILGRERIVGLHCPTETALADFADRLQLIGVQLPASEALPLLVTGCRQREMVLRKEAKLNAAP